MALFTFRVSLVISWACVPEHCSRAPEKTFANNYASERLKAAGSSQAASLAPNQGKKGASALHRD